MVSALAWHSRLPTTFWMSHRPAINSARHPAKTRRPTKLLIRRFMGYQHPKRGHARLSMRRSRLFPASDFAVKCLKRLPDSSLQEPPKAAIFSKDPNNPNKHFGD